MDDNGAAAGDFARMVRNALTRSGFVVPRPGMAHVLLFDSTRWTAHAMSAEALLDARERERAARFRFERDRVAYVLAHAAWRVALGICLGVELHRVPLAASPTGQPRLPGTDFATSLSHSGSQVAIAFAAARTIGVDIERVPARMAVDELVPMVCTPDEAAQLRQLPADTRERALLVLWTRKEALLKAFGVGLAEAPAMLSASTTGLVMPPASAFGQPPCQVRDLDAPTGWVGALAAPATVMACEVHALEWQEGISE